ncbi:MULTISPECIES: hypothetical protein [Streptomyces]|uniref:Uncharacterized protein n=2 Tax=Streptomyces rimosus subsp. rimosus TaxID=132474 RepID=L8F337_STRR1|nr:MULTISPECIES: hypothetical protein [Streptomyces]KOG74975.1 hypothetical protein ADK78_13455 [Kitasatospora aureofaciens]MYT41823.1 hypothetical protein [Streptomyces sp. SID5471]KOT41776.1 hypothetical protein ADK84_10485 [Streptomyces sp. NRRL WC-3701]KOT43934.1 hypothetical protein ADK42_06275 [Streptomyces rimosus subsp. rimosus]KOT67270.1 hypothetical protein ADK44_03655 [Streptomyces rimosus subsp. rimosus]
MDEHFIRVLLTLRRFIGVPFPGTDLHILGLVRLDDDRIRIRAGIAESTGVWIELPTRSADRSDLLGTWWYVGALRHIARWLHDRRETLETAARQQIIDTTTLAEAGLLPDDIEVMPEDSLDYVISDLAGDPLWHEVTASAAPELYTLAGFDLYSLGVVRVYLLHDGRLIAVDLSTTDTETSGPRNVGWWASTKLIAILNPNDKLTLAAHRVTDANDPHCDAVFDLTRWA